MNTKMKKILRTVAMVIIALMVVGGGVWMITGRSPMAIIVKSALHQMDTESYDKAMADKTDKSTTEIPAGVVFPREAFQYTIGNMQVFEVPAENDTKPVVLYLHGLYVPALEGYGRVGQDHRMWHCGAKLPAAAPPYCR